MTTPAKIEPWMVEAVKEMMVKHLGFGAFVGTNWMLLESDLVASIAAHAPEQEWEAGAGTKMTTKLQRYNVAGSQAGNWPSKDGDWCLSRDVVALEAENERLRKVTMEREEQLKSLLHATVKFVENYAPDHIKQELYNGLEKLNREQEKQP